MIHDRVAAFDNDGTLWTEQPLYTQAFFARDRIRAILGARAHARIVHAPGGRLVNVVARLD